jgi:glycosyltransferase involved in cell wall biosynthesis
MNARTLMIAYACNPEGSGEHWLGWGWAEQAARFGSVHLVTTPNSQEQVESHARGHAITAHFVGLPGWLRKVSNHLGGGGGWLRKIVWQYRVARLAEALHAEHPFQIVHQTTFHSFRVPFIAARLGIPSVWGPIAGGESVPPGFARDLGAAWLGEWARRLVNKLWLGVPCVRRSLHQAGVIFVSNRTTLAFLPARFRDKCVIVPPNALRSEDEAIPFGVPPAGGPATADTRPPAGGTQNASGPLRLLYVGNCVATRALPLVFAALRRRGKDDCHLTIVGTGPALPRWRRLVTQLDLSANVVFTGQVSRDKLPALYAQADALVFPALRDSGGSALLEAMARGVPVICFDWGGPGEMVDARSGIKIPVRAREETVAALADAITRLKEQPALRRELARAGRERAWRLFRWEAKAALLAACYQRLISGK